jgi:hypothetical protein
MALFYYVRKKIKQFAFKIKNKKKLPTMVAVMMTLYDEVVCAMSG